MSSHPPLELRSLLAELGFDTTDTHDLARAVLEEAQLTHSRKVNVDGSKREAIEKLLAERFHVSCGAPECDADHRGRHLVHCFDRTRCWVCEGSSNRRALLLAERAFRQAGIRRIVVVGGSPATRDELNQAKPSEWDLHLIDGTERRTSEQARADIRRADLVLVWGSSELDHKVSELYTRAPEGRGKVVHVARRGVEALLTEAIAHCEGGRHSGKPTTTRSGNRRRKR